MGVGSALEELTEGVGGSAAEEDPSVQAASESRPQQARTARKRVTTTKTLPRSEAYVGLDASRKSVAPEPRGPSLWTG